MEGFLKRKKKSPKQAGMERKESVEAFFKKEGTKKNRSGIFSNGAVRWKNILRKKKMHWKQRSS